MEWEIIVDGATANEDVAIDLSEYKEAIAYVSVPASELNAYVTIKAPVISLDNTIPIVLRGGYSFDGDILAQIAISKTSVSAYLYINSILQENDVTFNLYAR